MSKLLYNKKIADAVFEGGGVKGIGLVGALNIMEENGYSWRNIAGTSAGAVIASLISAGYSASELKNLIKQIDYTAMIDHSKHKFSFKKISNLIIKKGLYNGNYITKIIDTFLYDKLKWKLGTRKKVQFRDMIIPNEKGILLNNPRYKRKYKLHIIAADITRGRMLILPEDIIDYGINPDTLEVSLAVRMSISIPFFFQPIILENKIIKEKSSIVDGGILSNYPVWLFDENSLPQYPTIGFKLGGGKELERKHKTNNIINLSLAIIETMLEAEDDIHISKMDFLRTLKINTHGIKSTDFNITPENINILYKSGENSAKKFLNVADDNYRKYIELFKRKKRIFNI
ncbi:patatin-like phospholipase family protein [Clostridium sediminicola]|uniref:patatin-like phospholipase family protein n=1 Tax=Clostridium sediminicola TaxID=3114879 RepID=UPI0031F27A35